MRNCPTRNIEYQRKIKKIYTRIVKWILLLVLLNPTNPVLASPSSQTPTPDQKAEQLLNQLTPEERIGQLFLVTFQGSDISANLEIQELLTNNHLGGVIILAENDNINSDDDSLNHIRAMNRQLQEIRWDVSRQEQINTETGESHTPAFIPLFITISQEGDGHPYDQIINGVTPLPNAMALGSTWNTELSSEVGKVLGYELSALGINLLLGPSLDVLETPQPDSNGGLGTRSFGGDPYWVGQLGRAYIQGLHQGSEGRLAVVAKHFPGIGAADRPPDEEVATVRKSLEQLEFFDLAPFFDVTGNAPDEGSTTDGLLVSHIRYQGFQGNIRATTRPISLDQQALIDLMSLPALASWRENGGVMVSDDLGSLAVRRFYESTNPNQPFDIRRIALNAFLAGNDLLYLGNIPVDEEEMDTYDPIVDVLDFFTQKYKDDPAFAQLVDQSVLRILNLKYRLYDSFSLNSTLPLPLNEEILEQNNQVPFDVARESATLISPLLSDLAEAIPDPPNQTDRIVVITDAHSTQQCSDCPEQEVLSVDALKDAVTRLYGPSASNLITPAYIKSYSYEDLELLLNEDPNMFQLETDLRRAHWVVFAMLDVSNAKQRSLVLHRFLEERPDLFQQKRLVVFAFNAPYFLDATNISKLTAYYGLYSKIPSFVDIAARLLFREMQPSGALPVSVPGVGYDLISATMPDPNQIIPLELDLLEPEIGDGTATPEPLPTPEYHVGALISVRTGIIFDHNGLPVPDNTPVQFITSINGEVNTLPITEVTTDGIAHATLQVSDSGTIEMRVESEPAKQSDVLRFDIPAENGGESTIIPTEQPTISTPIPPTPTRQILPVTTSEPPETKQLNLVDWLVAMMIAVFISLSSYRVAAYIGYVSWGVRSGFLAFIGGLLAYSYLTLNLPGSLSIVQNLGGWGVVLATLIGACIGIGTAWIWRLLKSGRTAQT